MRLKADSQEAVSRFVRRVIASRTVWALDDDGQVARCDAHESGAQVIPVFSDAAYARRGAACWGDVCPVFDVTLEFFMETALPFCIENGHFVGPNWDGNMAGAEVEAAALLEMIAQASR